MVEGHKWEMTFLSIMCGLWKRNSKEILLNKTKITKWPSRKKNVSIFFLEGRKPFKKKFSLFVWKTVKKVKEKESNTIKCNNIYN